VTDIARVPEVTIEAELCTQERRAQLGISSSAA
jgi:hypothetical protein